MLAGVGLGRAAQAIGLLAGLVALDGCRQPAAPASDPAATPIRRLRRLSSREYNNVVRDLLGDTTRPADRFIADVYPNGYDNGPALLTVQPEQVLDYQAAAEALAATAVADRLPMLLGGCDPAVDGAYSCTDQFLDRFAARAYRRPLGESEAARLRGVIDAVAGAGGYRRGIQAAVEAILQSPQFLYREELGSPDAPAVEGATARLTDFEVASQLSFLVTGTLPDDELWQLVRQGHFRTVDEYRRQAERLLATPAARSTFRAFLHQWLATDRVATTGKDAAFYPELTPELKASMRGELDALYDEVLWHGDGSLWQLLSSNRAFVDPPLAALYGVAPAKGGTGVVLLDGRTRRGVLTRAGFLTVHSDSDSSGPIARGVFLLQALLCAPPLPRPASVPAAIPPGDPSAQTLTTRQRYEAHVADPFCAGCHRQIDGIGFSFERFDGIGRQRDQENGQPIDPTGELYGTGAIDGPLGGAVDLASQLAGAQPVAACFVRQLYRYAMGQVEPPDDALPWLADGFSTDSRIVDLVLALVMSPQFVLRTFEPAASTTATRGGP
jgi:hypothetical protein